MEPAKMFLVAWSETAPDNQVATSANGTLTVASKQGPTHID